MLEMYDGLIFDDGYIGEGILFKDYVRKIIFFLNGSLERILYLSFGFCDLINDFLVFDEDILLWDEMFDFILLVLWFDNDFILDI